MSTQWTPLYGPIVTPDSSPHVILTAPVNVALVITKFTISNITGSAANAIISIFPSGGALVQVYERVIPGQPVQGGIMEVVELEGLILAPGSTLTFKDDTGGALVPAISGVKYTA